MTRSGAAYFFEPVLGEDGAIAVNADHGVLANDSDPNGDPFTGEVVTPPANGELVFNADGSFTYTPDADFDGVDTFTYRTVDGGPNDSTATVTLHVTPINDPPVAIDDEYAAGQASLIVDAANGVLTNDPDVDDAALMAELISNVSNGTLTFNADGSFRYRADFGYTGPDSFTYWVDDGQDYSNVATVSITVSADPSGPVAIDDQYVTDEDVELTVPAAGVLANDFDSENDPLTATLLAGPSSGQLSLNADGSFIYTPTANFSGEVTFTYAARDAVDLSAPATVTIQVNPVEDAPVADAGGAYQISEGDGLTLDASGSFDADGDNLMFAWDLDDDGAFDDGVGETLALSWSELVAFGIDDDGAFSVAVRASDAAGAGTATATLTVVNTAPALSVTGPATIEAGQLYVLSLGASDPGDDTVTQWQIDWGDGTVTTIPTNLPAISRSFPSAGVFQITATVTDDDGEHMAFGPLVTVEPTANDPPTTSGINDVSVPVSAGDVVIDLFAAFDDEEDADADLVFTVADNTNPALFDALDIDAVAGTLTLDFASDTSGAADVTVRATDTGDALVQTTFRVVVNDPPTSSGIADVAADEDAADMAIDLFAAFDDSADDDDQLLFEVVGNTNTALFASVTIDDATGILTLAFAADAFGEAELTVRATDTLGGFTDETFTVTVAPQNDQPTTSGLADVSVSENAAPSVIDLFAAFADVEDADGELTYTIESNTNAALFTFTDIDGAAGELTLTYAADAIGSAEITVRATDAGGLFIDATFNVTVSPYNQIAGTVWLDANGDGVRDVGNGGQADVTVYLDVNENGAFDAGEPMRTTDAAGGYVFDELLDGSYLVAELLPSGFVQSSPGVAGAPVPPFEINVLFNGGLSASQRAIVNDAARRWSEIIVGDLPDVITDVGVVDDIAIDVRGVSLDGAAGSLAAAGPTQLRPGSFLPARGVLELDSADVDALEAGGELYLVVLHELAHVLGFGAIWARLGLIDGAGGADPRFTGVQAAAVYSELTGDTETSVPVANSGGSGTRDRHWRELNFDHELMTGVLDAGANPISQLTVASLADLGYVVNLDAADSYTMPGGASTGGDGPSGIDPPLPHTHRVVVANGDEATNVDFGNAELGNIVVAPHVQGLTPAPIDVLNDATVDIDITFSEEVTGVDATDLALSGSAAGGATVSAPVDLGLNTWRFTVTGLSGGELTVTLAPDADDIEDLDGNDLDTLAWTYAVDLPTPPKVVEVQVNGGDASRSMVTSLNYRFDKDVSASLDVGDLELVNVTHSLSIDAADLALAYDNTTNTAVFTFPGLPAGTLPDGVYLATLIADGVRDLGNRALDGNGDGTGGDDLAAQFHRYFGDRDGDADVDFADLFPFRAALQTQLGDTGYDPAFDSDADGDVDFVDLFAFRGNFQTTLEPPVEQSGQDDRVFLAVSEPATKSASISTPSPVSTREDPRSSLLAAAALATLKPVDRAAPRTDYLRVLFPADDADTDQE